jgi:hypothetical protein
MWLSVLPYNLTDVSEERTVSIFRVEEQASQETARSRQYAHLHCEREAK